MNVNAWMICFFEYWWIIQIKQTKKKKKEKEKKKKKNVSVK